MMLRELIKDLDIKEIKWNVKDINIDDISYNSKLIKKNSMFVCIKGSKLDGHLFAKEASLKGSNVFVVEDAVGELNSKNTVIKVPDTRKALADLSNRFFEYPSKKLELIGVTGTNGKTTTTYLIESIFAEKGLKIGVIGTIEYRLDNLKFKSVNTTPESLDLVKLLHKMNELKFYGAVIEVSSHSLEMHRVDNLDFDIAIFTNITHEHLDFHKSFENYLAAKIKLFKNLKKDGFAIINLDDENIDKIIKNTDAKLIGYSIDKNRVKEYKNKFQFFICADEIKLSPSANGTSFIADTPDGKIEINLKLIGKYNVSNALAAAAAGIASNIDLSSVKNGLENVRVVPGRFEKIENASVLGTSVPFSVFIDYAHTPDAISVSLQAARELVKARLITIFGCGGDRDFAKRQIMGEIVSKLSDITIITSDNPRSEDPLKIIEEIERGVLKTKEHIIIPDRESAIKKAIIELAKKGDVVLIAGKGHEDYQILKDKTIHFSDKEEVIKFLKEKYGEFNN